jgi:hypothetical protein
MPVYPPPPAPFRDHQCAGAGVANQPRLVVDPSRSGTIGRPPAGRSGQPTDVTDRIVDVAAVGDLHCARTADTAMSLFK